MGTMYTLYAEVNVDGKWYSLNPYIRRPDGTFKMQPIYWARSVFWDVFCAIDEERIACGIPNDMSEELRANFRPNLDEVTEFFSNMTWRQYYRQQLFAVNYQSSFKNRIVKDRPYKYQGYVEKFLIAGFECGECGIYSWLTKEEYEALDKDEKKGYAYYEWNTCDEEYGIYYEICSKIDALLDWFADGDALGPEYRSKDFTVSPSNVRIFVEMN